MSWGTISAISIEVDTTKFNEAVAHLQEHGITLNDVRQAIRDQLRRRLADGLRKAGLAVNRETVSVSATLV